MTKEIAYLSGWGGAWQSEALPNALPIGQNSPQHVPYGLYAEQLSGSAFTRARHQNLRSWLYRILPSVVHDEFTHYPHQGLTIPTDHRALPKQLRWNPPQDPTSKIDFIDGLQTLLYNGNPLAQTGAAVHLYAANISMENRFFYNADGEL
ncbi:MAG: homogentisate 1,2-dioxygenase, partial [Candidatus Berkiella sp.]